jgi:predicted DNA-binding transcriptional regulator YafY
LVSKQRRRIDPIPWYHRAEDLDCLPVLASAVRRTKRISIEYESSSGTVVRQLEPLGLAQNGGIWYFFAAARGKARNYRVSGIRTLTLLDAAAQRPLRFDLSRYWLRPTRSAWL